MKYVKGTRSVDSQTMVVVCQGEMDTLAVEELHQAVDPLLSDSISHLIFDLASVEYVSSSVLSFLMATQGKTQEKGGKVSLVGASKLVQQVFKLAALESLFDFRERLEDLGISLQPPKIPAKGKEKVPRKEKVLTLKGAKPGVSLEEEATPLPQDALAPKREQGLATNGQERKRSKEVEKIQPVAEHRSWRDYSAWIGIAAVVAVSLALSLYFYFAEP
jgi:anti-anti-sigma factor